MLRAPNLSALAVVTVLAAVVACQGGDDGDTDTSCTELGLCEGGAAGSPVAAGTGGGVSTGVGGDATTTGAGGGTAPPGTGGSTGGGLTEAEACPNGSVDGEEAQALVAQGAFLLDVRTPEEYAAGHIDGATNIPVEEVSGRTAELPTDTVIVTYCRSGSRSATAAQTLRQAGLEVCDLGPMSAW